MNELDLDALERLEADATLPPWVDYDDFIVSEGLEGRPCADRKTIICQFFDKSEKDFTNHPANVIFIAAARNALPALIARARRADELETFLFDEVMPRYAEMCEALNIGESVVIAAARKLVAGEMNNGSS